MKPNPMEEVLTAIYLVYKHLWKDGKKQIETVSHTFDGDSHNEMTIEVDMTGRKKTDISIFKNVVNKFLKSRKFLDFSYKTIGHVDQIHISLRGSKMDKSNLKETIKSEIRKSLKENIIKSTETISHLISRQSVATKQMNDILKKYGKNQKVLVHRKQTPFGIFVVGIEVLTDDVRKPVIKEESGINLINTVAKMIANHWYINLRPKYAPILQKDKLRIFAQDIFADNEDNLDLDMDKGGIPLASKLSNYWFNKLHAQINPIDQKQKLVAYIVQELKGYIRESIIKEESKMIDIKKWWEYEPKKIMSFIYWQQRQIPPIDSNKWNKNWQDVIKQLNHKFPAPELDVKRLMAFKK